MENNNTIKSGLQKDINRIKKRCDEYQIANTLRKYQISQFNLLIKKLLNEGRITKEEIAEYICRKEEAKTIIKK